MLYNLLRRCWRIQIGSGGATSVLKCCRTGVATFAIIAVPDGQAPVASRRSW